MPKKPMSIEAFSKKISRDGWVLFDEIFDMELVERLRDDLAKASQRCHEIMAKNGVAENTYSTAHHLPGQGDSFLELLDTLPVFEHIESYFGGKFILYSFGGNTNTKGIKSHAHHVHRDIRTFSGERNLMLNMLVMLDDFTLENGATYLMTGSHRLADKPDDETFFKHADRAVGKAGSVLTWNTNLFHCAGENKTDKVRRIVSPIFCVPYLKTLFDYPRALGYDKGDGFSERIRQIIGYNSRVPATLDEWYQPPEKRMYKPGQG